MPLPAGPALATHFARASSPARQRLIAGKEFRQRSRPVVRRFFARSAAGASLDIVAREHRAATDQRFAGLERQDRAPRRVRRISHRRPTGFFAQRDDECFFRQVGRVAAPDNRRRREIHERLRRAAEDDLPCPWSQSGSAPPSCGLLPVRQNGSSPRHRAPCRTTTCWCAGRCRQRRATRWTPLPHRNRFAPCTASGELS